MRLEWHARAHFASGTNTNVKRYSKLVGGSGELCANRLVSR